MEGIDTLVWFSPAEEPHPAPCQRKPRLTRGIAKTPLSCHPTARMIRYLSRHDDTYDRLRRLQMTSYGSAKRVRDVATRVRRSPKLLVTSMVAILCYFALPLTLFADEGMRVGNSAIPPGHGGNKFYYSMPAYLYETYSASGIQVGYQLNRLQFRLDGGLLNDSTVDEISLFVAPALGIFYMEDWPVGIRTYQGLSVGTEFGILHSFEGLGLYLILRTGAEWFVSERKALFLEIGKGTGVIKQEGAYNGGTIIGGGFKVYL